MTFPLMKKFLVIPLIIMCIAHLQAQVRIGDKEAFSTARRFLQENTKLQSPTIALSETINSKPSGQTNLYMFSVEPQGFVIVSAMNEVLAYSFETILPKKETWPDSFVYWLELYNEQTDYIFEHSGYTRNAIRYHKEVEPLLSSKWGQGCYYNEGCPVNESGPCQHVVAGCAAIAMAQIMYYHKQPSKGTGSMTYSCPPYGNLSADFGQTVYPWEEMSDSLVCSNPAVALLVSHCGISVKMNYGPETSYAFGVLDAFRQYFSYPTATWSRRSDYDEETWLTLIKNDLDLRHPVYFKGQSNQGVHAFVCDGYDNSGLFHFNFGWDGLCDGYFTLGNPYGFSAQQSIITDLIPIDDYPIQCDDHGIIYVAPDGNGDGSSWENATSKLRWAVYKYHSGSHSIWVKEGTYYGNLTDSHAFVLQGNCKLYGGFKGDEPFDYDLSLRDFSAHPSILDGSNSQGVIHTAPTIDTESILIDGFTIQNGNSSVGGGIFLQGNTRVINCKICFNHARLYGGGLATESSNAKQCRFINCTIDNNSAPKGGGIYCNDASPVFWSCLINNNTAHIGGGCYLMDETKLYNCTIVKNEGTEAYGGVSSDNQAGIRNCIAWGNISPNGNIQIAPLQTYSHCAVQNDPSGTENNFNAKPENDGNSGDFYIRFINSNVIAGNMGHGGDWRLQPNSFCIDRVDLIANQPEFDLDGNPRLRHQKVDLGAYESNTTAHFIEDVLCEDNPYLIHNTGYYSVLYPGNHYDSLVILHVLGIKPLTSVYMEKEICNGETFDFFGESLHETGHYSTTIDCKTYELDLTVNPNPYVPVFMEEEICEGETYNFYGMDLKHSGHYSTMVNCIGYELDLTVNPSPTLQCSNDTLIEYGKPVQLIASGADSYLWSTGDTTDRIIVIPKEDKTYSVTGFSELGCSRTANIKITIDLHENEAVVYPNPANEKVEIYMPLIDEVEIFNLVGTRMDHVIAERKAVELDVSHYPSGVYIVHVRQLNNHYYKKLIIQH